MNIFTHLGYRLFMNLFTQLGSCYCLFMHLFTYFVLGERSDFKPEKQTRQV